MAIKEKTVFVKLHSNNVLYYEKLGYQILRHKGKDGRICVPQKSILEVKIEDLMTGCNVKVTKVCDYCKDEIPNQPYNLILKHRQSDGKDSCYSCGKKKAGRNRKIPERSILANRFPELALEWHPNLNGKLTPYDVAYASHKEVWWLCEHGHEWCSEISRRTQRNLGCTYCNSPSKGEEKIKHYLSNKNVLFKEQYTIKGLLGLGGRLLKFDFAILNEDGTLDCLLEFDGRQHYMPVNFGGISDEKAFENFKIIQSHDQLKNEYCKQNSIHLIRISYFDFNNIEYILNDQLKPLIKLNKTNNICLI